MIVVVSGDADAEREDGEDEDGISSIDQADVEVIDD